MVDDCDDSRMREERQTGCGGVKKPGRWISYTGGVSIKGREQALHDYHAAIIPAGQPRTQRSPFVRASEIGLQLL
jgi:hypothetical protein